MTEADYKRQLVTLLKVLPGALPWRIEDLFTAGIADIVVTWHGRTSWIEGKLLKTKKDTLKGCRDKNPLQLEMMQRLAKASGNRAWYVVWDVRNPKDKRTLIYAPAAFRDLRPVCEVDVDHYKGTVAAALESELACSWPGIRHDLVANLIEQTHGV